MSQQGFCEQGQRVIGQTACQDGGATDALIGTAPRCTRDDYAESFGSAELAKATQMAELLGEGLDLASPPHPA